MECRNHTAKHTLCGSAQSLPSRRRVVRDGAGTRDSMPAADHKMLLDMFTQNIVQAWGALIKQRLRGRDHLKCLEQNVQTPSAHWSAFMQADAFEEKSLAALQEQLMSAPSFQDGVFPARRCWLLVTRVLPSTHRLSRFWAHQVMVARARAVGRVPSSAAVPPISQVMKSWIPVQRLMGCSTSFAKSAERWKLTLASEWVAGKAKKNWQDLVGITNLNADTSHILATCFWQPSFSRGSACASTRTFHEHLLMLRLRPPFPGHILTPRPPTLRTRPCCCAVLTECDKFKASCDKSGAALQA